MRGATGSVAGRRGLVPKPAAVDNVKYLKGDGTWSALANASAATNAEAAAGTSTITFVTPDNAALAGAKVSNSRAPRQGLAFNGTTSCTVGVIPAFGTGDFSVAVWVMLNAIPTTFFGLLHGAASNCFGLRILAAGAIDTTLVGVSDNPSVAAGLTTGVWYLVGYTRAGTTGQYYVNGVALGATITDSRNYSAASNTIGPNLNGTQTPPIIENRTLSAAEMRTLFQSGAPASADYNAASNTTLFGAANWVDAGGFTGFASASPAAFSATSAGGAAFAQQNSPISVVKGRKYRFAITTNAGGQTAFFNGGGNTEANTVQALAATGGIVEITAAATGVSYLTVRCATGFTTASAAALTPIGLLLAPEANAPGNGFLWNDQSGAFADILLPSSGVVWSLPDSRAIVVRGFSYTNGSQQLNAAACIPVGYRITSIQARLSSGGSPTVTLGSSSGATDVGSSTAISSTAWKVIPIASGGEITTTTSLWANANSTAVVLWQICAQRLSP